MGKLPPPPVIEGTLKEPICSITFGLLVSLWSINLLSLLTPNYFAYVFGAVLAIECCLWFVDKPRRDYEVYKPPAQSKRQAKVATPSGEASHEKHTKETKGTSEGMKKKGQSQTASDNDDVKAEKKGKEARFRFRHKKNIDSPESTGQ